MLRRLTLALALGSPAALALTACGAPPVAHLSATPNPVVPGQTVTLDARGSTNRGVTRACKALL